MKHQTLLLLALGLTSAATAQTLDKAQDTWNESAQNEILNIRYNSSNPVRLSYNTLKNFGVARIDYGLTRGDFHAPTASGKVNDLNVYFGGLKNIGRFDVSGFIQYSNTQNRDQIWNSTLGLRWDNPLFLSDSVKSHQTIEQFKLNATASYRISNRWKAGASISLNTGTLSDQTDPRPETKTSILPITIGAEYLATKRLSVGLSAGVRFYRSDIDYTIISALNSCTYFLMKGNGDYMRRTSSEFTGYSREYHGTSYNGGLQLNYDFSDAISDHLEVGYEGGHENAKDGGSTPFRGGDYKFKEFTASNRLAIKGGGNRLHNIILAFGLDQGDVDWYDQRKITDTEHNNRVYYETLSKYKIHHNQFVKAQAEYRLDFLKDGRQDLFVDARVGLRNFHNKHYNEDLAVQKATLLDIALAAGKNFELGRVNLNAQINAGYTTASGDGFADGSTYSTENIAMAYDLPMYQYQISSRVNLGAKIDASMPVGKHLRTGIFAHVNSAIYTDNGKYWDGYDGKSLTSGRLGLYLSF